MVWLKGERQDVENIVASLYLGLKAAWRDIRGEVLTPEQERELREQARRNAGQ
jgi:hypothetical protein